MSAAICIISLRSAAAAFKGFFPAAGRQNDLHFDNYTLNLESLTATTTKEHKRMPWRVAMVRSGKLAAQTKRRVCSLVFIFSTSCNYQLIIQQQIDKTHSYATVISVSTHMVTKAILLYVCVLAAHIGVLLCKTHQPLLEQLLTF